MEEKENSLCSTEKDLPREEQEYNWEDMGTHKLPKAGGISSTYSYHSGSSSLNLHHTNQTPRTWPNPDAKLSDPTNSSDPQQTTTLKLLEKLANIENSYK